MSTVNSEDSKRETKSTTRPVAVIDIGATSIRMAIGEIGEYGGVRRLDSLTQAVNLGKDTFTHGAISKASIEDCVRVLKSYRRLLDEYQITSSDQIRVIATSAVREASNRLAFIDRIYIATGLQVEPIDEAEVNRVTYLGVQPFLEAEPQLAAARTIVTEVGGGNTEVLVVKNGNVVYAHTYRLGSLRLRETLGAYRAPTRKLRDIMKNQILRTVQQIQEQVHTDGRIEMIALGGDVRFAATQLLPDWVPSALARVPVPTLEEFTNEILELSEDEIVRKFHLTFQEAETVGPALLAYVEVAKAFNLVNVLVTNVNLRYGLLQEMAVRNAFTDEFRNQIIRSAIDLGRRFDFHEAHARHVAELARTLFEQLRAEHQLDARYETILYIGALLHEIGLFIAQRSYHKHSMYVIRNSEIFGLGRKDLLMASLIARYHRRASPQPTHEGYSTLDRDERVTVAKLAALLRVAISLDESRSQRIQEILCQFEDGKLVIAAPRVDDLALEQLALRQNSSLFEEVFGMQVQLRTVRR
ncbi:MAG: Ppx/GppA phosphatase family protein [Pirellulaceae bacterium]|nr:Ppx/GppA family phosphatase [Planctomycetales bacterium]MCA9163156.1 Ppx/GppA family phosphatase [Planctomycetales bacterium]MCA9202311.1 Ppx/GppA family phosphatase [Planctomycetales bacterium]MCA9220696.1 Ppx/GppA family phosphatase [Planctomycetales bacterium]MCA9226543.1 Ppx/GppA family phosphatase [Planctomycetales bacterium]